MKVVLVIAVLAVVCVILFVTGLFSPSKSRRMQSRTEGLARKGQDKGEHTAGRMGDMVSSTLKKSRKAAGRSAEKGRELHDRFGGQDR